MLTPRNGRRTIQSGGKPPSPTSCGAEEWSKGTQSDGNLPFLPLRAIRIMVWPTEHSTVLLAPSRCQTGMAIPMLSAQAQGFKEVPSHSEQYEPSFGGRDDSVLALKTVPYQYSRACQAGVRG